MLCRVICMLRSRSDVRASGSRRWSVIAVTGDEGHDSTKCKCRVVSFSLSQERSSSRHLTLESILSFFNINFNKGVALKSSIIGNRRDAEISVTKTFGSYFISSRQRHLAT